MKHEIEHVNDARNNKKNTLINNRTNFSETLIFCSYALRRKGSMGFYIDVLYKEKCLKVDLLCLSQDVI